MEIDIILYCPFCEKEQKLKVNSKEGWVGFPYIEDEENFLCPDHALLNKWKEDICKNCVGGWTDCDLWKCFAYSYVDRKKYPKLTDKDFNLIAQGFCPKYNSCSFTIFNDKILEDKNIPSTTEEIGTFFAKTVKEYIKNYPLEEEKEKGEN